jgi:hypothetical protein
VTLSGTVSSLVISLHSKSRLIKFWIPFFVFLTEL